MPTNHDYCLPSTGDPGNYWSVAWSMFKSAYTHLCIISTPWGWTNACCASSCYCQWRQPSVCVTLLCGYHCYNVVSVLYYVWSIVCLHILFLISPSVLKGVWSLYFLINVFLAPCPRERTKHAHVWSPNGRPHWRPWIILCMWCFSVSLKKIFLFNNCV